MDENTEVLYNAWQNQNANVSPRQVLLEGVPVAAVLASEIDHIKFVHCNKDIRPQEFEMKAKTSTFEVKLPVPISLRQTPDETETVSMKGSQIPALSNNATTGHKLQGCGVESLFVHNWSYKENWAYVVLSRVKTSKGLFIRNKLKDDLSLYKVPIEYKRAIENFNSRKPHYLDDEAYRRFK